MLSGWWGWRVIPCTQTEVQNFPSSPWGRGKGASEGGGGGVVGWWRVTGFGEVHIWSAILVSNDFAGNTVLINLRAFTSMPGNYWLLLSTFCHGNKEDLNFIPTSEKSIHKFSIKCRDKMKSRVILVLHDLLQKGIFAFKLSCFLNNSFAWPSGFGWKQINCPFWSLSNYYNPFTKNTWHEAVRQHLWNTTKNVRSARLVTNQPEFVDSFYYRFLDSVGRDLDMHWSLLQGV